METIAITIYKRVMVSLEGLDSIQCDLHLFDRIVEKDSTRSDNHP